MHAYDVSRRQSFQSTRSTRPAQEHSGGPSATPIYDALYAEYVKSFRSLPGDRSGEDEFGFTAFASIPHGSGSFGGHRAGSFSSSYSAYSAGAQSARHGSGQLSPWQRVGQIGQHGTGMHHVPAALPPGPRKGS
ncbi:hypothetical protein [Streptomyces sp. PSKA30]|uniref:hypothetical protein n=1 Tax=Streptomyces sp. PSKA30 TaxID=2874597 RepID=UPI001CD0D642|nr:hypothetical protein [Streptomyces sp. PSKA30]MBZ9644171.1 hypothetical protein [Streptomyces sp. PSKA30]